MNLVDFRPQGFGKTTDAINRAVERAKNGEQTIYVVDSYAKAEEFAENCEDSMVFKGKPQPSPDQPERLEFDDSGNEIIERMCKRLPRVNSKLRLYEKLSPRFLCKTCKDRSCQYLLQCEQAKECSIIFTVKENLNAVLKLVKNATVALDDVSPISIFWHRVEARKKQIEATVILAEKKGHHTLKKTIESYQAGDYDKALELASTKPYLQDLIAAEEELLRTTTKFEKEVSDKEFELQQMRYENKKDLEDVYRGRMFIAPEEEEELLSREPEIERLEDKVKDLKQTSNFNIMYALYDAAKARDYEFSEDAIEWKDETIGKAEKLEFLKASLNSVEVDLFAELGEYETVKVEAPNNDNVRILQVANKNTKTHQYWRPDKYFLEPCKQIDKIADFCRPLSMKIRVVTPKATIQKNQEDPVLSGLKARDNVDFDYHYSPQSSGSNRYIDYNIHTSLGLLYKQPGLYKRAPYKRYIEKVRGLDPSKSFDQISKEIAEEEQVLYQRDLAERLRLSTATGRKLVIIFGDINLSDWPFDIVKTDLENFERVVSQQISWLGQERLKLRMVSALKRAIRTGRKELKPIVDTMEEEYGYFSLAFYREKVKKVAATLQIQTGKIRGKLILVMGRGNDILRFDDGKGCPLEVEIPEENRKPPPDPVAMAYAGMARRTKQLIEAEWYNV